MAIWAASPSATTGPLAGAASRSSERLAPSPPLCRAGPGVPGAGGPIRLAVPGEGGLLLLGTELLEGGPVLVHLLLQRGLLRRDGVVLRLRLARGLLGGGLRRGGGDAGRGGRLQDGALVA